MIGSTDIAQPITLDWLSQVATPAWYLFHPLLMNSTVSVFPPEMPRYDVIVAVGTCLAIEPIDVFSYCMPETACWSLGPAGSYRQKILSLHRLLSLLSLLLYDERHRFRLVLDVAVGPWPHDCVL